MTDTRGEPQDLWPSEPVLGEGLDIDRIHATYEHGVLTITIPVAASAQPRKIEVGSEPRKEAITAG